MDKAREEVHRIYGNRVRTRVCGICIQDDKILMVRHRGISTSDTFWCPPGGGIQFSETAHQAIKREFLEETGFVVNAGKLLFVSEFLEPPLHAMELFFLTEIVEGNMITGKDPEMSDTTQIITEVEWMTFEQIKSYPEEEVHRFFQYCTKLTDIFSLDRYLYA